MTMTMTRKLGLAGAVAAIGALAVAATVAAAGPQNGGGQAAADALKLTREQVMELRHDGLSLAGIAEQQGVATSDVVDALMTRWTERIEARVENGALTEDEATALTEQVRERAEAMVAQTEPGGMQGMAVGAGGNGAGNRAGANGTGSGVGPGPRGDGDGTGACDGTGPHGPGRP